MVAVDHTSVGRRLEMSPSEILPARSIRLPEREHQQLLAAGPEGSGRRGNKCVTFSLF